MAKVNTSGERDGRIAIWPDGGLIGDFPGLRLRETAALKIDRFNIELRVRSNTWAATTPISQSTERVVRIAARPRESRPFALRLPFITGSSHQKVRRSGQR
jgi:hypothetical protein